MVMMMVMNEMAEVKIMVMLLASDVCVCGVHYWLRYSRTVSGEIDESFYAFLCLMPSALGNSI